MKDGVRGHIPVNRCRVLVVEDQEKAQRLIEAFLRGAGITNLAFAVDGYEALSKVRTFEPDLIVLDIMMPRMDGGEFLRRLRGDRAHASIPVLVQTALESPEERNQVFANGASDMVTKPLNRAEFVTRVRTHLENRILAESYQERLRLEAELDAARQMQEALLPPRHLLDEIGDENGLAIDAHFETCSELGGDFWGIHRYRHEDNKLAVFTADFSGHGVAAALNTFRLHTMMNARRPAAGDPAAYLGTLNRQLAEILPRGQFATMFYGIIDVPGDVVLYAAAAVPPLFVRRPGGNLTVHDASGLPLGVKADAQYENRRIAFTPGSALFLYSDGLSEALGHDGTALEQDGVERLLAESLAQDWQPPLRYLVDRFHARLSGDLPDDLTAVLVSRTHR